MIINSMDTKDITVVVQGAICQTYTPLCLKSIRKHLPESKIILSTWEGSDIDGLDYDEVLLNKDPGPSGVRGYNFTSSDNTNRQILSTKNGLKQSKTKYSMKLRTDFCLTGHGFLKYFDESKRFKRLDDKKLFKDRIITIKQNLNTNFFICDFFFFGLTEDGPGSLFNSTSS